MVSSVPPNSKSLKVETPGSPQHSRAQFGSVNQRGPATAYAHSPRLKLGIVETLACLLIFSAASLMIASSWDDSQSWDEGEHLTSGYLCLAKQRFQVNCWHPPLMKDIAATPLLFMDVKAPPVGPNLQKGNRIIPHKFLYESGNDAQNLLRAARVSLILVVACFYSYFFLAVRRYFGRPAALLALTLLCCSPTFLAHGRYITNDVLAAAAFFICITEFVSYLFSPTKKRLLWIGFLSGVAQLVKFSLVLLYPLYALLALIHLTAGGFALTKLRSAIARIAVVGGISLAVIACVYCHHTWNLPASVQQQYNDVIFARQFNRGAPLLVSATQDVPPLRGLSWYITGLSAQSMRVCIERPSADKLFMGRVVDSGLPASYFPILIATKEPLGFLGLFIFAAGTFIVAFARAGFLEKVFGRSRGFAGVESKPSASESKTDRNIADGTGSWSFVPGSAFLSAPNFLLASSLLFVCLYLAIALTGKVTLGIRHLAPVFPFAYMAASVLIAHAVAAAKEGRRFLSTALVFALLSWGCLSSLSSFPGFLAYFNELAGGKSGGANIVNDSNYDWGTDLLRLRQFMDRKGIAQVYLRYVGTASPEYYLGPRFIRLKHKQLTPSGAFVAMSVRYRQRNLSRLQEQSRNKSADPAELSRLEWFSSLIPVGRAGDSILVYRTP